MTNFQYGFEAALSFEWENFGNEYFRICLKRKLRKLRQHCKWGRLNHSKILLPTFIIELNFHNIYQQLKTTKFPFEKIFQKLLTFCPTEYGGVCHFEWNFMAYNNKNFIKRNSAKKTNWNNTFSIKLDNKLQKKNCALKSTKQQLKLKTN